MQKVRCTTVADEVLLGEKLRLMKVIERMKERLGDVGVGIVDYF